MLVFAAERFRKQHNIASVSAGGQYQQCCPLCAARHSSSDSGTYGLCPPGIIIMAPGTTVHVSIAVFKGDPVDYQKYRHTALWFRFADQTPSVVMHAVGLQYEFLLKTEHDRNPTLSRTFAKEVQVGHLEQAMTKPQLVALVTQTPIKNSDPEFNCQQWVENVLRSPMDKKYLSKDQYNESLNGMTDATLEAEDESQAQV